MVHPEWDRRAPKIFFGLQKDFMVPNFHSSLHTNKEKPECLGGLVAWFMNSAWTSNSYQFMQLCATACSTQGGGVTLLLSQTEISSVVILRNVIIETYGATSQFTASSPSKNSCFSCWRKSVSVRNCFPSLLFFS